MQLPLPRKYKFFFKKKKKHYRQNLTAVESNSDHIKVRTGRDKMLIT